jgi:IS1 family transposase/transposase-like protein
MITTVHCCTKCGSSHLKKNGKAYNGKQKYYCHDCQAYGVLNPEPHYSEERKEEIICAYQERGSLRGIERIFGVARQTVAKWIKEKVKQLPDLKESLKPAKPDDVLELDELWSFVFIKTNKQWVWIALCRRTRQVVAFVIGDRSARTCQRLWNKIPDEYKSCQSFSDFWEAYRKVFPEKNHKCVGKESGETSHVERWNNTLRQRISRFVRKTLSFSKKEVWHHMVTKLFVYNYNISVAVKY